MEEIIEMKLTCLACPSMWDLKFADGSEGYLRYRFGNIRLVRGSETIAEEHIGDDLDGFIDAVAAGNWIGRQGIKISLYVLVSEEKTF